LALYDKLLPQNRPQVEAFAQRVAERLESEGLSVKLADVCCVRQEVEKGVELLKSHEVDLLATLHLSYAPSLESVDVLASSQLPIALLDTTSIFSFTENATMDDMLKNHGLHGVQDLACMLRRRSIPYSVIVGHVDDREFIREVARTAKAARAANRLRVARVLIVGDEFKGMGDFSVQPEVFASVFGITVSRVPAADLAAYVDNVSDEDLAAEASSDAMRFDCSQVAPQTLRTSNRVGLALRAMLEKSEATDFSFNFQSFDRGIGLPTVPFFEASKAMSRGLGYGGEGDALAAALIGSLLQASSEVTFTEMFCPDWAGDTIFMSHMAESNPALAASTPRVIEKEYAFGNVDNPAVVLFPLPPGVATLVNLAPGPGDKFSLITSRVLILDRYSPQNFPDVPHFWIKPADGNVRDFLRRYSECGGTHHLALMLGDEVEIVRNMAEFLDVGFEVV
jgi:L-arabinose isomerase